MKYLIKLEVLFLLCITKLVPDYWNLPMKQHYLIELKNAGLEVKTQVGLPFVYEDIALEIGYRVDIMVENKVIIEVKSVDQLADVHYKQLLTYLKLSEKKLGILVNFNTDNIEASIKRIVNHLEE